MPVFSFDEMLCIKPANMDHRVAEFRYSVSGGSARNFKRGIVEGTKILPIVDSTLTMLFPDFKADNHDSWMSACVEVSKALNGKATSTRATANSMMWHFCPKNSTQWGIRDIMHGC